MSLSLQAGTRCYLYLAIPGLGHLSMPMHLSLVHEKSQYTQLALYWLTFNSPSVICYHKQCCKEHDGIHGLVWDESLHVKLHQTLDLKTFAAIASQPFSWDQMQNVCGRAHSHQPSVTFSFPTALLVKPLSFHQAWCRQKKKKKFSLPDLSTIWTTGTVTLPTLTWFLPFSGYLVAIITHFIFGSHIFNFLHNFSSVLNEEIFPTLEAPAPP